MEKVQVKLTNRSASGTSFHGHTVVATYNELKQVLGGDAQYVDADKSNYDFVGVCDATNAGIVFTVYDWKRPAFGKDQTEEWHIGLHDGSNGSLVRAVIERELDVVRKRKQILDIFEKPVITTTADAKAAARITDFKAFLNTKLGFENNRDYVLVPQTDEALCRTIPSRKTPAPTDTLCFSARTFVGSRPHASRPFARSWSQGWTPHGGTGTPRSWLTC
jgi:hypothetical protein